VGIGTIPKATLHVVGDIYHNLSTVSQDFNIVNATGNSRLFVDNSKGYIGIATTAPSTPLDIRGEFNGTLNLINLKNTYNAALNERNQSVAINAEFIGAGTTRTAGKIIFGKLVDFRTDAKADGFISFNPSLDALPTEVMRIEGNGNVGINVANPSETLEVNGTLKILSGSGTQGLFQDSNANVGIGTTTPNATFTVASGKTTIADEWTVRSDRDIKTEITNYDYIDILNHPLTIYRYKYKYQEPIYNIDEITGERTIIGYENKISREHIGIMADEAPQELLGADGQGIDIYAFASYVYDYAKKVKAENDALKQALCLEFPENELCK